MGQYFVVCNMDKKEFLDAGGFNHGYKLAEIGRSADGMMAGLTILLALSGSFIHKGGPIYGRWANDRIAIVGDYYSGMIGDIQWSENYHYDVERQRHGWVDITEHVVAVLREDWELQLPVGGGPAHSVLHEDGTITAIVTSEDDDNDDADMN